MARLRLVIFDVDGTIVDSQAAILAAMAGAFTAEGLACPPRERVLGIVGLSLPKAMAVLEPGLPAARHAALVAAYKHAYGAMLRDGAEEMATVFYPGAEAAIHGLDRAGYLLGIATGKARRGLVRLLDETGLAPRFVTTQTADDAPSKPAPGMVLNCLAGTGVAPEDAVMVGDTVFDIEMARAAGVRAIGVGWGYHPAGRLEAAGAERVLSGFDALEGALAALWEAA